MTEALFNDNKIAELSKEIDKQLDELSGNADTGVSKWIVKGNQKLPEKQCQAIEKAAAEDADTFLKKFNKAAKADLCEKDGVLFRQWQKWGDLSNDKVIRQFGVILAAMGLSGNALQIAVVALGVIVIHIGIKAFCMEK